MRGSDRWQRLIIIAALRHYDESLANSDGDSLGWTDPEPSPTDLDVRCVRDAIESGDLRIECDHPEATEASP